MRFPGELDSAQFKNVAKFFQILKPTWISRITLKIITNKEKSRSIQDLISAPGL